MKVLLIYPPDAHMIRTNVPSVVDEESGCYPPIGLLYVASYAQLHSDHEIEVLDAVAEGLTYDQVEEEVRRRGPDVVGIQTLTFTLCDAILTAQRVKRVGGAIKVVLGGPHVYIFPEETLEIPEVDYIVLGEGEDAFCELLEAIEKGSDLSQVKSIGFRKDGQPCITELRPLVEDLDALPHPDRRLLPIDRYRSVLAKSSAVTTLISSRGCPFQCVFCDRPHLGKRFRARSARNVFEEMHECKLLGIDEIIFYDDTFTIDRNRVLEVCRLVIENRLDIAWDIRAHINTMDEEVLKALRRAGCIRIHYGIESGNERVLKALRKTIKLDRAREVIRMTRKLGIQTLGYFIVGNPTETEAEIEDTIEFALTANLDYVHAGVMTPFPATDLYRQGLRDGILPGDYWREYARNPTPDFVPHVWEEHLSAEELNEALLRLYKRFYRRPTYLARRILEVRSPGELIRKARAGIRLLTTR